MPAPEEEERVTDTSSPVTWAWDGRARPKPRSTSLSVLSPGDRLAVADCPSAVVAQAALVQALVPGSVSTTEGRSGPAVAVLSTQEAGKATTGVGAELAEELPALFDAVTVTTSV